jgi:hypothetical protein
MMLHKVAMTGLCVMGLSAFAISAKADLVTNGDFSSNGGGGQLNHTTYATDWSVAGSSGSYAFLFTSGAQAVSGVPGQYGTLGLYGPIPSSPDGGAFIGADPSYQPGAISQTINGLTVGANYVLSFDWAGAEQTIASGAHGEGPTTEGWQVSLGGQTQSTGTDNTPAGGFSAWQNQQFTFTATSTSELLSFLATGGPSSSLPPFSLLDGVSLNQVTSTPEPASWTMLVGGLGLLGCARFTRAKNWFKR